MDLRGFLVRVTDGMIYRHTIVLAPDLEFARTRAATVFEGTKWRVWEVLDIPR